MLAIVEAGLSVPGDIAVLGYDDREFAADLGLSTLIQPHADMAMRAMAILARGRDMELPSTISVRRRLVPRNTTMPVNVSSGYQIPADTMG